MKIGRLKFWPCFEVNRDEFHAFGVYFEYAPMRRFADEFLYPLPGLLTLTICFGRRYCVLGIRWRDAR